MDLHFCLAPRAAPLALFPLRGDGIGAPPRVQALLWPGLRLQWAGGTAWWRHSWREPACAAGLTGGDNSVFLVLYLTVIGLS